MTILEIDGLTRHFAGLTAVEEVGFTVAQGSIHALVGPNGAGKTTLFNMISGLLAPSEGSIRFQGLDITRLPRHRRAALGIGRTFQNLRLFGAMSVLENLLAGMHARLDTAWPLAVLACPPALREERRAMAAARELLELAGLSDQADQPAASLSYGAQRRLELARALAGRPSLLLLDEPAAGMNPKETADLAALLRSLRQDGLTLLLVEHDMSLVMRLSDRLSVLNFGRLIADGPPEAVRKDPKVIEAYLGSRAAARLADREKRS